MPTLRAQSSTMSSVASALPPFDTTKIALLCSGLGHVVRGHEVFARGLFDMMAGHVDIHLFKGAGDAADNEQTIACVKRGSPALDHAFAVAASPQWANAVREQARLNIEHETFAYAALEPLLALQPAVVHCLEQEVCRVVHAHRHLFRNPPRILFSNGGAIPADALPPCDAVQEHTEYNLAGSLKDRAFCIPHGVDTQRFRPGVATEMRARLDIPSDAFTIISVGTVCFHHKRMDHVIREVAALPGAHLLIVGQDNQDTPAIHAIGREALGGRVHFMKLAHEELPQAYAAADAFALGSLHETFGIVYIEAMAMGLPVFCTNHPNQRSIVREGVFVDMARPGALAAALRDTRPERRAELGRRGREIAVAEYDLARLRQRYLQAYRRIASLPLALPATAPTQRLRAHLRHTLQRTRRLFHGSH